MAAGIKTLRFEIGTMGTGFMQNRMGISYVQEHIGLQ